MTIGDKIKYLRISQNYTQEELAQAVQTKKQTIHKYETGIISNIPASKIKLIADFLNTTPAYLMGWEDDTKPADASLLDVKFAEILANMSEQTKRSFVNFMDSETNRKFFELLINASENDLEWIHFLLKAKHEERNKK